LEQVLMDIDRVVQRAGHLLERARQSGHDGYMGGVVLNPHSFYSGVNSCFDGVAKPVI